MAILFNDSADKVNWGDVTTFDGITSFTWSFWAKLDNVDNTATGRRWISKWGDVVGGLSFLIGQVDGDGNDIVLAVSADGSTSTFSAYASTSNILSTGNWDHYLCTWTATGNVFTLLKNNSSVALTNLFTGTPPHQIAPTTTVFTYGQDGASTPLNGILGSLAEIGAWNRLLTADERGALADGIAPIAIRRGLIHYADCARNIQDRRNGFVPTLTSVDAADHPRVFYPSREHVFVPSAAAAASVARTSHFLTLGVGA